MAELKVACSIIPAGESPVRVSAGAHGSRPQAGVERPTVEEWRQKPLWREQDGGPQQQVNSTDIQPRSRAAQLTAKAKSWEQGPGEESFKYPCGVRGAARGQKMVGNRRSPSRRSLPGRGASYKPMVKSTAVQRESEEVVVTMKARHDKPVGGKDPWGGHGGGGGKREGMASKSGLNNPSGLKPVFKPSQDVPPTAKPKCPLVLFHNRPGGCVCCGGFRLFDGASGNE